eukprot:CAMPEP_0181422348 /NCGR_PEP_ID=MMETSP1110-20121109/13569_1 /TAXON_ID=174948 /ORGANISM="Symbiodinium sp., Strain CCMP421" /LENGTH=80 /DNA_ID=CAMNT_0023545445 /DNA_START=53 /DNA_END=296 /DNA_ORIENTATION=-
MAVTSLRALPMLLMVALGGSEVAPSNETHWGNFVSCSCGLTCEKLEGAGLANPVIAMAATPPTPPMPQLQLLCEDACSQL